MKETFTTCNMPEYKLELLNLAKSSFELNYHIFYIVVLKPKETFHVFLFSQQSSSVSWANQTLTSGFTVCQPILATKLPKTARPPNAEHRFTEHWSQKTFTLQCREQSVSLQCRTKMQNKDILKVQLSHWSGTERQKLCKNCKTALICFCFVQIVCFVKKLRFA